MWWNYLSIPKLQRLHRWSLGMDKLCHRTLYDGCNYLSPGDKMYLFMPSSKATIEEQSYFLFWVRNRQQYLFQNIAYLNTWLFIRPFQKRTYYATAMSVRLSVRPSVRPSVRVFRTFFQRALRYQFQTWYMHSVGGTTCRVWVSSQLGHFDLVYSQK